MRINVLLFIVIASFSIGYSASLNINADGSVGIGTTNTGTIYKFAVNGRIRAKEIRVETNWSDYVFNQDYKLLSLEKVEQFISKNGHLPEVPSAKEVEANGVDVGSAASLLLKKIEELTLYVIQQDKRIKELEVQASSK